MLYRFGCFGVFFLCQQNSEVLWPNECFSNFRPGNVQTMTSVPPPRVFFSYRWWNSHPQTQSIQYVSEEHQLAQHSRRWWNQKSRHSCLSPTRPNKQRQGLNLYGCFFRMACNLRRWWIFTLPDSLKFHFKPILFFKKKRSVGKGFGI